MRIAGIPSPKECAPKLNARLDMPNPSIATIIKRETNFNYSNQKNFQAIQEMIARKKSSHASNKFSFTDMMHKNI